MSKRRAKDVGEEARRVMAGLFGEEKGRELAEEIERYSMETGKSPDEVVKEALEAGVRGLGFQKLTAGDLLACVRFLNMVDVLFYRRIYVTSPIKAVTEHAEEYSKAIQRILEAQAFGLSPLVEKMVEQKMEEKAKTGGEQARGEKQQAKGNRLLEKALDTIMTTISEEIASRVGVEIAEKVSPELREKIEEMIRKGEIIIRLPGEEIVGE